jgi:hypothetical protein
LPFIAERTQNEQKMLEKLRKLPLNKRIIFFIVSLILWFVIIQMFSGNNSGYQQGKNIQTIWIISTFFIAGFYAIFFPNKKKKDK